MQLPKSIRLDKIENELLTQKGISLQIARLDQLHPVVSGNKLFKLHFFLQEAIQKNINRLLTFGGPYSNHLVATAYACRELGLESVGLVRGESPAKWSPTLVDCKRYGMELHFLSRNDYSLYQSDAFRDRLVQTYGSQMMVPEGGFHPLGAAGAALIPGLLDQKDPSHVVVACGTYTTIAGLAKAYADNATQIIAIEVLNGMKDQEKRLSYLSEKMPYAQIQFIQDAHAGGYAKYDKALLQFMNDFHAASGIPTDFVYTGKMMKAVYEMIGRGDFPEGSRIICIHSGGLQGNRSLPDGSLHF